MKDEVLFVRFQVRRLVVHRLRFLRRPAFPLPQVIATSFCILPPIDGARSGLQTRHSTTRQHGCTEAFSGHHLFSVTTHFSALWKTAEARDSDARQHVKKRQCTNGGHSTVLCTGYIRQLTVGQALERPPVWTVALASLFEEVALSFHVTRV